MNGASSMPTTFAHQVRGEGKEDLKVEKGCAKPKEETLAKEAKRYT